MTNRKQIGPRVPPEVWEMFKDYSEEKHGKQGMASEELTEAMLGHIQADEDTPNKTDSRATEELIQQIELLNTKMDYMLTAIAQMPRSDDQSEEQSGTVAFR